MLKKYTKEIRVISDKIIKQKLFKDLNRRQSNGSFRIITFLILVLIRVFFIIFSDNFRQYAMIVILIN